MFRIACPAVLFYHYETQFFCSDSIVYCEITLYLLTDTNFILICVSVVYNFAPCNFQSVCVFKFNVRGEEVAFIQSGNACLFMVHLDQAIQCDYPSWGAFAPCYLSSSPTCRSSPFLSSAGSCVSSRVAVGPQVG